MKEKFCSIPVVSVQSKQTDTSSVRQLALLHEIETKLEMLVTAGRTSEIDLHHSPLSKNDILLLENVLGEGEIKAQFDSLGTTTFTETSISGVWWVTHRNQSGMIRSEQIEVTCCPEMLCTSDRDLRSGLGLLKFRLSQQPADGKSHQNQAGDRIRAMGFCALDKQHDQSNLTESVKRGNGNAK